jgi:hypothetical protein
VYVHPKCLVPRRCSSSSRRKAFVVLVHHVTNGHAEIHPHSLENPGSAFPPSSQQPSSFGVALRL